MGQLHLNGINIPFESCEMSVLGVNETNGWSPSGVYQHQRTGSVRQWKVRSGLLSSDMRIALIEMLGRRGDAWRFPTAKTDTGWLDGSNTSVYRSDMRRRGFPAAGVPTDPVAEVDTGVADDGSKVYDAHPWDGAGGALWCEDAYSNLLSSANANPELTTDLADVNTPAQGVSSSVYVTGSAAPWFYRTGAGYEGKATTGVAVSAATRYVAVANVQHNLAGQTFRMELKESGAGAGSTVVDFSTNTVPIQQWGRYVIAHTTTGTPGNLSLEITENAGWQYWYDALALYARAQGDEIPWIAGGSSSTQSDLRYANPFTDSYRNGFCLSFWMKRNGSFTGSNGTVCAAGSNTGAGVYAGMSVTRTNNKLVFKVFGQHFSSMLVTAASDMPASWAHYLVSYNPNTPEVEIWINGVSDASSTTLAGKYTPDMRDVDSDLLFGKTVPGGFQGMPGPVAAFQVLPFPGSTDVAAGLYNAGNGAFPGPQGVIPMTLTGDIFADIGGRHALVTPKLDSAPNDRWFKDGVFQHHGGRVAFTLTEVTSI